MFFINSNRPAQWLPNWSSYFITGLMALLVSFVFGVLSGCRFGNNQTTTATTGGDTITGYYESQPQSLNLTVINSGVTNSMNVTTNFMPLMVSTVMTNPLAIIIQDHVTGQSVITNQAQTSGFSIFVTGANTSLAFSGSDTTPWTTNCTETDTALRRGSYSQYGTGTKPISGVGSMGRVRLDITSSVSWAGTDCPALAVLFHDCFVNQDTCWGNTAVNRQTENSDLHTIYDPFIDSGVMTVDQIKTVSELRYETNYQ